MILAMILAGLAQPTPPARTVEVEVRNSATGQLIGSAWVIMQNGSNAPQRYQTTEGRYRFNANCADDVKYGAVAPDDVAFPTAAPPRACQLPLPLIIKLRPGH